MKDVNEDTVYYREDHLHEFSKKNARLRFSHSPQTPTEYNTQSEPEYYHELNEFTRRKSYINGVHVKSSYTLTAHLWLLKQALQSQKWRFVSDEDETIMNAFYRVFNDEIGSGMAHHFLAKVDRNKTLPDAYHEQVHAKKSLKDWAESNGIKENSIRKIAALKLSGELKEHPFHKVKSDRGLTYKVWAKDPIEHPLPPTDKGYFQVDCTTDLSSFDESQIANMILKVSDRPTNNFMQQIRRRLSILERPLVTARGSGKCYIYANFNPKYAQMALTILKTYFNFCLANKTSRTSKLTPAQQLGLTDKQFTLNDILYFK